MSTSNLHSAKISARRLAMYERYVEKLRTEDLDRLIKFCKMHLAFILDMDSENFEELFMDKFDSNKSKLGNSATKKKQNKKVDSSLIHEKTIVVDPDVQHAVNKLIVFLHGSQNLCNEGLFRKTGNISRQRELKEKLESGEVVNFIQNGYSAHDCASVLKAFLSDLSEPLLLERLFNAFIYTLGIERTDVRIKTVTLLLQMLPTEHYHMAKNVFALLHKVTVFSSQNKMDADNLGAIFAPHMLCPKRYSGSDLQSKASTMQAVVSFIIQHTPYLFIVPEMLALDTINYLKKTNMCVYSSEDSILSVDSSESPPGSSHKKPKVSYSSSTEEIDDEPIETVVSFAQRTQCDSAQDTEVELAKLYAHVQSMPDSAKKRKLLRQFSEANGYHQQVQLKRKHSRSKSFKETIKKRFGKRKRASLNMSVESHMQTEENSREKTKLNKTYDSSNAYRRKPSSSYIDTNVPLEIATLCNSPYLSHRISRKNLRENYRPDGAECEMKSESQKPHATEDIMDNTRSSLTERLAPDGGDDSKCDLTYKVPAIKKPLFPCNAIHTPELKKKNRCVLDHKNTPPCPKKGFSIMDPTGLRV